MVQLVKGNLFDSQAQTLVNTVNCVGVMGKGIALEFKKRFPEMYDDYARRCAAGEVRLGQPYLFRRPVLPWILNFPTKGHWRSVARLSDIVRGLEYLTRHYKEWGITSLAVPPLGCGHGQLDWTVVGPTLQRYLDLLDIPVELYVPQSTGQDVCDMECTGDAHSHQRKLVDKGGLPPRIEPGHVALVEILARIESEPYHWPVGRTTFQKIAYFATMSGLPTGLEYEPGSYGPFTPALKRLMTSLVNNGLLEEREVGRMFKITVGPGYASARQAHVAELSRWQSVIDKVADLFLRMNTRQAEIAASVHYAARALTNGSEHRPSESQVLAMVTKWKQRRYPPLDRQAIADSIRNLAALGWLEVAPSPDLPLEEPPEFRT
ncbi:MAG: macro domain-containing protein [Bacteroidota bacterium]